jgi:tRNA1Val (adenine37-N6)-methyltransferase
MKGNTLHAVEDMGLDISQPQEGYRFSVDSLLLADFCRLSPGSRVLDLGTGCGVIALVLARKFPDAEITAVEIQEKLVELAVRNILQNEMDNRISVIHGDINSIGNFLKAQSMDHVVSNPPYRPPVSGRICANSMEAVARHEILTDIDRVIEAARYALRPGGRFSVIFPAERIAGLLASLVDNRLEPKRMRMVHPAPDRKARMCMVEACRDSGRELHILPPLFLNFSSSNYDRKN